MPQSFPLQWPDGWPRTVAHKRTSARYKVGFVCTYDHLMRSLALLGAHPATIVLSTNVPLRRDGKPYADEGRFDDPGVAIYWSTNKHTQRVIACDRWLSVHHNIHAIGLTIDALRSIDRAGATQVLDQAFAAFGALPASADAAKTRPWWEVLELSHDLIGSVSFAMVKARFRELATSCHPDKTGSDQAMAELNRALQEAEAHYAK